MKNKNYNEQTVSVRVKIAGLWSSMLFIFAYVDIFGFYRSDILNDALAGKVGEFTADQTFFVLTTLFILIPSLMVYLSLVLRAKTSRLANIVVAALYIVAIIGAAVGESWHYYLLGSAFEVMLLSALIFHAYTWPKN